MSIEGTIGAVVMLIAGMVWLALPILRRRYSVSGDELEQQKQREALVTTYERTLASLRDVDEDHLTGKLEQQDYESERAYWTDQGVAVLAALEKLGGRKSAKTRKSAASEQSDIVADPDAMLDEAIEQTIARYIKSTH